MRREENMFLCQVGPGTPMGAVMRRYWMPFALSSDLPKPDSDPARVRLFGEDLVAFRDTHGTVGLLDEYCMHRGVSLAVGRVEDGGIRCLYHGWKFGADGAIQETPNHCDARLRARLKAPVYKVREEAGLLWAYMGPAEAEPPFRRFAFMDAPEANRTIFRIYQHANYLQLVEQGSDSSHVGVLHSNDARPGWLTQTFTPNPDTLNPAAFAVEDNAPALELENTRFGFHYAAFRQEGRVDGTIDETRERHVRVYPYLMPTTRFIPAAKVLFTVFEVALDDTNTATFLVVHGDQPANRPHLRKVLGLEDDRYWSEEDNTFRGDWTNRMGQDRRRMSESWTGFPGVAFEDAVMGVAAGPICDRTKEHLVTADAAVVRVRRLLQEAAETVATGGAPRGV
ncbi:MAG TPA: Rieske 2Fe-2S domain-containing protein, partial [Caulobacteraceae bacterium]|nr:Rieske 2Fe-2S domain-containing protein [Caulobacteraceae bacterium]